MRRQAVPVLSRLMHFYGLKPWEIPLLTNDELDALLYDLGDVPPIGWVVAVDPPED